MKRGIVPMILLAVLLTGCNSGVSQSNYDNLQSKYDGLSAKYENLQSDYEKLSTETESVQVNNETTTDGSLTETIITGWGLQTFGNAECSKVGKDIEQLIITTDNITSDNIKDYHDKLIDSIPNLISTKTYMDYKTLYIKFIDPDNKPVMEYAIYADGSDSGFMIGMSFIDYVQNITE